ncbi:probable tubulin polyglutamylase TTLL2 isoform X2 [Nilaparvata lugens]|uniref:probable tubulin polyglutamylase TTLL2 isoform X2 n=1 Tax=Nilaparvata lugens TaxID=108931 RepID=UPI00193DBD3A|nr:probable tubulin polyglutamylase TTLL2 isoform X2 [Nilaparvata lugens]
MVEDWRIPDIPLQTAQTLFTNHIPKGSSICRKDNLSRYLKCMKKVFGSIYDFSPEAFNLPLEYTKLVAECSRQNRNNYEDPSNVWICKPVGLSQGRGISLFKKLSELVYDSNAVVQKYVQNPLLIGGYKFDLRLYVCVPSFHPPVIYLYREGLARFSTDKFSLSNLDNPFAHLTNTSLNKMGPRYTEMKDRIGAGCKWSLKQLRYYMNQSGMDDWLLWQRILSLVVLTVVSQLNNVPASANCFEFYGFDVLVDSALRPWLLEVNLSPALGNHCDVDPAVKKPMLHDMFDLLGLPVCCTGLSLFTIWSAGVCGTCTTFNTTESTTTPPLDTTKEVVRSGEEKEEVEEKLSSSGVVKPRSASQTTLTVVTMANRWRRRQQQTATVHNGGGSSAVSRRKTANSANPSATTSGRVKTRQIKSAKVTSMLPTVTIGDDYSGDSSANETINEIISSKKSSTTARKPRSSPSVMWGNGRNWDNPPAQEGDWMRVYPLGDKNRVGRTVLWENGHDSGHTVYSDREIRSVVINMNKHLKCAKEVFKKQVNGTDESRNDELAKLLGLKCDLWLPNK